MMHRWGMVGLIALLVAGCAGAPSPSRPRSRVPVSPLPAVSRNAQEVALEVGLGEFYGAPYHSGGTTPAGVDCSGLVVALYQRAGINLPRTVAQQYHTGRPVKISDLRFGDVLFFNRYCQIRGPEVYLASLLPGFEDKVCHNGIYLGDGRFVHASPRGVVVSLLDAKVWKMAFRGARRYLPEVYHP